MSGMGLTLASDFDLGNSLCLSLQSVIRQPLSSTHKTGPPTSKNKHDTATVARNVEDAITSAAISFLSEPIGPYQCIAFTKLRAELVQTHLNG